jgi:phosphohistidine phosphatase
MIFGHNPTFTDFVNIYQRPQIENLPTSAVAAISFKTDKWENIPMAKARVDFLISPKMLK